MSGPHTITAVYDEEAAMTDHAMPTPLERLQLREALQDRWRDHVRRITELSVELHTALDADDDCEIDAVAVRIALGEARLRLTEIEQAMRRIDDRTYGRCLSCLMPIPAPALIDRPDTSYCTECGQVVAGTIAAVAAADVG